MRIKTRLRSFYVLFLFITISFASNEANSDDIKAPSISINDDIELDENVYVLTEKNFDAFLEKNPTTLIEFYAPWYILLFI